MSKKQFKKNSSKKKRIITIGILYLFLVVWIWIFSKGDLIHRFIGILDPSTRSLLIGTFTVPAAIVSLVIGYLHTMKVNMHGSLRLLAVLGIATAIVALSLFLLSVLYSSGTLFS